jgi:phosphoserine aminotransferase
VTQQQPNPAGTRPYNFSAGPAAMPEAVLQRAASEMLDWQGSGMSVMEMSHRGKEFGAICTQAEADIRSCWPCPNTSTSCSCRVAASARTPSCR